MGAIEKLIGQSIPFVEGSQNVPLPERTVSPERQERPREGGREGGRESSRGGGRKRRGGGGGAKGGSRNPTSEQSAIVDVAAAPVTPSPAPRPPSIGRAPAPQTQSSS